MTDLLKQIIENSAARNPVAPQQENPVVAAPRKGYTPVTKASLLNMLNNEAIRTHVVGLTLAEADVYAADCLLARRDPDHDDTDSPGADISDEMDIFADGEFDDTDTIYDGEYVK